MPTEEKFSYFVGLDIGTTAVRCCVGELSGDSPLPKAIALTEVPNTGLRKGNVAHIDEVAEAVANAVTEAERVSGRQIKNATININGSHVEGVNSKGVIAISSPDRVISQDDRLRVEEAATIVQLPANKDIIQVFAKNYRLDNQDNIKDPVGMHGVRLEVDTHILLASTQALRSMDQALARAELAAAHRTVSSLAAAEAVLDRAQRDAGVAVVDIGAATTNIIVIEDGEVEHIGVISMGGTHVTNDLAIGLKTDLDVAEMIKVKYADLSKSAHGETSLVKNGEELRFDKEMIRIIAEARMAEILEYVDKELKKIHRSRKLPGGIVLTGGAAKLPGLVDLTKDELELPARLASWKHIERVVDNFNDQRFAPVIGLMLLDMLLGPSESRDFVEQSEGLFQSAKSSLSSLVKLGRRRRK